MCHSKEDEYTWPGEALKLHQLSKGTGRAVYQDPISVLLKSNRERANSLQMKAALSLREQSHFPTRGIWHELNKQPFCHRELTKQMAITAYRKGIGLVNLYRPRLQTTNYINIYVDIYIYLLGNKEDFIFCNTNITSKRKPQRSTEKAGRNQIFVQEETS